MVNDSEWAVGNRIVLAPDGSASVELTLTVEIEGRSYSTVLPLFHAFDCAHDASSFVGEWTAEWMVRNIQPQHS